MTPPPRRERQTPANAAAKKTTKGALEVDLPAGGRLTLQDAAEVDYWQRNAARYVQDYGIIKANDLVLLGAILSQGIAMYRAQQLLADPKAASNASNIIAKTSEQITLLEKQLGIDRKTREAGGQHTTADYVTRLKRAAHAKGVRISARTKEYEAFVMELRWKLRLLRNGDDEDRTYHNLSPETILAWAENELAALEARDKKWAHEVGKVFVGKL